MSLLDQLYDHEEGIIPTAFKPLQEVLERQAQTLRPRFSPWLVRTGKGGSQWPEFADESLFRHCMDVTWIALFLFILLWQKGTFAPQVDKQDAIRLLKRLILIGFAHDADKYGGGPSRNPTREEVAKVYADIEAHTWCDLTVDELYVLVCEVEVDKRGLTSRLLGRLPQDSQEQLNLRLAGLIRIGDKTLSIAARKGLQAGLRELVHRAHEEEGIDEEILPLQRVYVFQHQPAVLHELHRLATETLLEKFGYLPLLTVLNGEQLRLAWPDTVAGRSALEALLIEFGQQIQYGAPRIKREGTDGSLAGYNLRRPSDLASQVTDPRVLSIHITDWDSVEDYVRSWVAHVEGTRWLDQPEQGKIVQIISASENAIHDGHPLHRARIIAVALRLNIRARTDFDARVQQLKNRYPSVGHSLDVQIGNVDQLDINTQQTLYALQGAMDINDEETLDLVGELLGNHWVQAEAQHPGVELILSDLRRQAGFGEPTFENELPYQAAPKGGTCLLCGRPTPRTFSTKTSPVVGIKGSAFNNRIGHRKSVWTQSEKNYICEGCEKAQELLADLLHRAHGREAQPSLIATPLRCLVMPTLAALAELAQPAEIQDWLLDSWAVHRHSQEVHPWNLDLSGRFPIFLESLGEGLEEMVHAMVRTAWYALESGNPVHVFASSQREVRAAYLFEMTPPLVASLTEDLWDEEEPYAVRRDRLPAFLERINLLNNVLRLRKSFGSAVMDALEAIPEFGWWPIAWLDQRIQAEKDQSPLINHLLTARKVFTTGETAMSQPFRERDSQVRPVAALAARIQRWPGFRPSGHEKTLAFGVALDIFDEHLKNPQKIPAGDTIAAMADRLEEQLRRSELHTYIEESSLRDRCRDFAEAAYDLLETYVEHGDIEARTRRFLRAAYGTFFMELSEEEHKRRQKQSETINEKV